jgi:hypothetical protein
LAAGGLIVVGVLLGACNVVVSNDGPSYSYSNADPGLVTVTAPSNAGSNEREFFYDQSSPVEADSTVCATFADGHDIDQQGIVLRLNWNSSGVTGITVSRNIFSNVFNVFNFHAWDTGADPSAPFSLFGDATVTNLSAIFVRYPIRMCAQIVGNTVEFVEWTPGQPEPAWGSVAQGGSATIPADAPATGKGGYFISHLVPGTSTTFEGLTVDGVTVNP